MLSKIPAHARFITRYVESEDLRHEALRTVATEIAQTLEEISLDAHVERRLKSPRSTWRKMLRYNVDLEDVHDLLGVRVILTDEARCRAALDSIISHWSGRWRRLKDYITYPKPNGYQSIHLCILPTEGPRFEVQIRTHAMHHRSELGQASHLIYKQDLARQIGVPQI